jgi:hypothetical protein
LSRGHKTPPEIVEKIKALAVFHKPSEIAAKLDIPKRTVYDQLARRGPAEIEAEREGRAEKMRADVWDETTEDVKEEIATLKAKGKLLLDNLSEEKVQRARVTELTLGYAQLFDKRRLLEQKSTENISHKVTFVVVDENGRREKVGGETDTEDTMSAPEDGEEGDQAES